MEEFALEPGEQVVRTVRKHWLVFVGMLFPYFGLAILPLVLPPVLRWATQFYPEGNVILSHVQIAPPLLQLLLGAWWFILWVGAFNAFTSYFLNVWYITSHRIVEVRQFGFFDRKVSSFLLVRVQDVTTNVEGIIADLFGFGRVQVETAGTASHLFVMEGVADPVGMRDLIMREIALLHPAPQSGL